MKKLARFISVLLSIVLLAVSVPITALPQSQDDRDLQLDESASEIVIGQPGTYSSDSLDPEALKVMGKGEKTLKELQEIDISKIDFPKFISKEKAVNRGHANRLHEQERNLNTVIYQNRDGSKTAYIFTKPVKYVDSDGNIKDKNTNIVNCQYDVYSYAMLDNSVKVYFPTNITNGILMNFNGHNVKMLPVVEKLTSPNNVRILNGTAYYSEVFGAKIDLQYTTLLNGIKEDIVIKEYDGQSSFDFILETNGLIARKNEQGLWQLIDGENTIYTFEKILIRDSSGKTIFGDMNIYSTDDGTTKLNIEVPTQFLLDDNTQYPVYVDPTAYIDEISYSYDEEDNEITNKTIIDTGVYSDYDDYISSSNSTILDLGACEVGTAKIIYQFPDFYDLAYGSYLHLNKNNIGRAVLHLNFLSNTPCTLVANPMTAKYSATIFNDLATKIHDNTLINAYSTAITCTAAISSSGEQQLDITEIVHGWANYNSSLSSQEYNNPENGLILSLSNTAHSASIASTEYSTYADDVYLELDYSNYGGEYYLFNISNYKILGRSNTTVNTQNILNTSGAQKWIVEYCGEDEFYIRSANDPQYLLSGSGSNIVLSIPGSSVSNNYKWNIRLVTGGGVIIKNIATNRVLHVNSSTLDLISEPNSSSSAYDLCRWGIFDASSYVEMTNLSLNDNWIKPGTSKYFNVSATPKNASFTSEHFFSWTISNTNIIGISNSPGLLIGISRGKTTLTITNRLTGYSQSFVIACGAIREGTYMLLNKATGMYMEVENSSTLSGAYIQQGTYHTNDYAKWNIELLSNGDYIIQSAYSQKYLRIENGATTSGAKLIQFDSSNWTSCRWIIEDTNSGAYRITPMLVSSFAISVPLDENQNGTNLVQLSYSNDSNYQDEWIFDNVGETNGITSGEIYNIMTNDLNVISVAEGKTNNGQKIIMESKTPGRQQQRWQINYIGNGEYKIKDMNSNKLLSITASSSSTYAKAQLWYDDGTTGQIFKIRENTDGTYSFFTKCSNYTKVLTVSSSTIPVVEVSGQIENKIQIEQYPKNNTSGQNFSLIESNKAIIIVPGFGGSALQIGPNFPSYSEINNKLLFGSQAIDIMQSYSGGNVTNNNDLLSELESDSFVLSNILDDNFLYDLLDKHIIDQDNLLAFRQIMSLFFLACDQYGNPIYDTTVKAFNIMEAENIVNGDKYGVYDTYKNMFNDLSEMIQNSGISGKYAGYDLTLFTYDWRQSCSVSAQEMNEFITSRGYNEAILISHSLGGLVSSGYMALGEEQRNTVSQYISLGTPYLGLPLSVVICATGNIELFTGFNIDIIGDMFDPAIICNTFVDNLISTFPSIYETFPTQRYIENFDSGIYLQYEDDVCYTYAETKRAISRIMLGYNAVLMNNAEQFHQSLFINNKHVTTYTDYKYMYGINNNTCIGLIYDRVYLIMVSATTGINDYGDGIVPAISACMNDANSTPISKSTQSGHVSLATSLVMSQILNE